jgi:hypothetical protein
MNALRSPARPLTRATANPSLAVAVTLLLLAVYLLLPLFTATQVETYSAQVQIDAIAANEGLLARSNLLYPVHIEYFYTSRLGVVLLLQAMVAVFGPGDSTFHLLVAGSFLLFCLASIRVAARFGGTVPWLAAVAFLLTPGLAELGFSFNDSVVSAALGMVAITLLPGAGAGPPRRLLLGLSSGMVAGFAMLARLDGFLFVFMMAAFAWLETPKLRALIGLGAAIGTGLVLVLAGAALLTGVTLLQIMQVGGYFAALPVHQTGPALGLKNAFLFIGLPSAMLGAIGAVRLFETRTFKRLVVLYALPAALLALAMLRSTEIRQLFPIAAPFVLIHVGEGVGWATREVSRRKLPAAAVTVAVAACWLMPPISVMLHEGPRTPLGRFWAMPLWLRWQSGFSKELADASRLAAAADRAPATAIVALHDNSDAFIRLRLWQRGFRPVPAATSPDCHAVETYRSGNHRVYLIRTIDPHMIFPNFNLSEALQLQAGLHCPAFLNAGQHFITGTRAHQLQSADSAVVQATVLAVPGLRPQALHFDPTPLSLSRESAGGSEQRDKHTWWVQSIASVDSNQITTLSRAADLEVRRQQVRLGGVRTDYDALMGNFGYHYWCADRLHGSCARPVRPSSS